jgi:hemerythrin-like domain-containing protein
MLKILKIAGQRFQLGEKVNIEHLEKLLNFLKIFADTCHHGKEEKYLFTALEAIFNSQEKLMISQMLEDHKTGQNHIKNLSEAFADYKAGNLKAGYKIAETIRNYIELLTQHIQRENNVLFQLADDHLSEDQQTALYETFEEFEETAIGMGTHEKLHSIIHELKGIYLN